MDNALYAQISRQSALKSALDTIANNVANMNTTGFRRENVVFSEHVAAVDGPLGDLALSAANARYVDERQGMLTRTGGAFDLAIEGRGYFQLETPQGPRLTRAGAFTPNAAGELVNPDGLRLLDAGGAPIFIPPDAREVTVSSDGAISADGRLVGQVGVVDAPPETLTREGGLMFATSAAAEPVIQPRIAQGFLEGSNVNAVEEIARLIETQRAYELGSSLMTQENDRVDQTIQTLGRPV